MKKLKLNRNVERITHFELFFLFSPQAQLVTTTITTKNKKWIVYFIGYTCNFTDLNFPDKITHL